METEQFDPTKHVEVPEGGFVDKEVLASEKEVAIVAELEGVDIMAARELMAKERNEMRDRLLSEPANESWKKKVISEFNDDKKLMEKGLETGTISLRDAGEDLRGDVDFVKKAVAIKGCDLEYASSELKNDRGVVLEAIKNNPEALQYASNKIRNDPDMFLTALKTLKEYEEQWDKLAKEEANIVVAINKSKMRGGQPDHLLPRSLKGVQNQLKALDGKFFAGIKRARMWTMNGAGDALNAKIISRQKGFR